MVGYSARQMEFLNSMTFTHEEIPILEPKFQLLSPEVRYDIEKQVSGGLDGVLSCAHGVKKDCVFILNPILLPVSVVSFCWQS
jgi:hypothetical protein